jgi:prolyl 4-hydroxylase
MALERLRSTTPIDALRVEPRPCAPFEGGPLVRVDATGLRLVSEDPPIYLAHNFLPITICEQLMQTARRHMQASRVVGDAQTGRTSDSCLFRREDTPAVVERVLNVFSRMPGGDEHVVDWSHVELPQVGRYRHGQEYREHFDAFDASTDVGRACIANGGQRIATVLIYLNNVRVGGATYFPHAGVAVRPRAGTAVIFFPASLDGVLDHRALHAALPAGDEKWVSQIWVRAAPFNGVASVTLDRPIVARPPSFAHSIPWSVDRLSDVDWSSISESDERTRPSLAGGRRV